MKVFKLKKPPLTFDPEYYEIAEFSSSQLKVLKKLGADIVFYWYIVGDYEGAGNVIFKIDGKWYLHNARHCSCYGPLDEISLNRPYNNLNEMLENCSEEYKKEIKPLVNMAKLYY